ncbi:MAG TPA: hypothetical protein VMF57_21835 [Solirubrobacteraceae bacterium]|nr:hypothetical protein [Solirubrobacteraceae bacterium]
MRLRRRSFARQLPALVAALGLLAVLAGPAAAANQFTLDRRADSIGPVVVDQSANGYVAWLHKVGAGDVDMFCKLPPGAGKCAHPITLPASLYNGSPTDTPFTILGPSDEVFVVAPSYDSSQFVIWESTDGGASFGPAYIGPSNAALSDGLDYTDTCNVATGLDDVLPVNAFGGEYDRSQGTSTLSPNGIEFEMSSADPFATWSFDFYGEPCSVSSSTTVTPGRIPAQWFGFDDGGLPDAGIATDQTTLGWARGGTSGCPLDTPGDEVEAYSVGTSSRVQFFRWSAPTGPCTMSGDFGANDSANWDGPSTIAGAQSPRLASGAAGLFLLSGDAPSARNGSPTAVDIRRYGLAGHTFGAPTRLAHVSNPSGLDPDSGGLGENYTTGELAAVWPDVAGDSHLLSLFISTDGGAHFSSGLDVARIGFGYAGLDDARVAVAANGNGFVTWLDASGLHVADLAPTGAAYEHLTVQPLGVLELPVTCEAPTGICHATARVTRKGVTLASGQRSVHSGQTKTLRLPLSAAGQSLLPGGGRSVNATLELAITRPGVKATRLVVPTKVAD